MSKKTGCLLGGCVLVLLLIVCVVLAALGWLLMQQSEKFPEATPTPVPTWTPVPLPTSTASATAPSTEPDVLTQTLTALQSRRTPANDPIALARRLWHVTQTWATPAAPPRYRVGDETAFWVSNGDTNETFRVQARLAYLRPHVYFWVEKGISVDEDALRRLVDTFEDKIYPTDRAFFGSEWTPGIDGDPHLYILYARNIGSSIAGYFSSVDELPPFAHKYSNAHEMFVLSADHADLHDRFTYGVLAHEFQHMIHWYHDLNETTWLNEGASDLAAFLNGYGVGGADFLYAHDADLQLNAWADPQVEDTTPHYGASFLFLGYFLGRYGKEATRTLIGRPENGLTSVDLTLKEMGADLSTEDLFVDWTLANYLQDPHLADGRYGYQIDYDLPWFSPADTVDHCPTAPRQTTVHQYGVDYIAVHCKGDFTFHFNGATQVSLFPAQPHSGQFVLWSGYGDASDMSLTRQIDLRQTTHATLHFWTWYDIEKDYDYGYVEVSTDGQQWELLRTPSGTSTDPSGNNYGWGYTGSSGGGESPQWIEETVDLTPYAGQKVWLRFEYITDAAVNHTGWLLDDVSIPEIGYREDFEHGLGGWEAAGFVRVGRWLPQAFRVTTVTWDGRQPVIQPLRLDATNRGTLRLHFSGKPAMLLISGVTRITHEPATYQWWLSEP